MRVSVFSAYRFHMFALAGQLEQRGSLARLYTTLPKSMVPEVSDSKIITQPAIAASRKAWETLFGYSSRVDNLAKATFDRWTSRQSLDHTVAIGLSGFATHTLMRSQAQGTFTVCDRGSQHILAQLDIIRREYEFLGMGVPDFDRNPRQRDWGVNRELLEYANCDHIVVPSTFARESFIANGIAEQKISVIPYGVDLQIFGKALPNSLPTPGRVLSVGAVIPRKGTHYLISAYRRARRPGSTLRIVGSLDDNQYLGQLSAEDEDIQFPGIVPRWEVAHEMQQSWVFALASVEEGLPLVFFQALASGLPVIAFRATGIGDLITDGQEGFVIPDGDVETFSLRMQEVIDDADLRHYMSNCALRRAQSFEGWNSYGETYTRVLQRLTSGSNR